MPGQCSRPEVWVKRGKDAESGQRMDVEGRLGVDRIVQIRLRPVPHQPRKRRAKNRVCLLKGQLGGGESRRELSPHSNGLRALAGENKGSGLRIGFHCISSDLNTNEPWASRLVAHHSGCCFSFLISTT